MTDTTITINFCGTDCWPDQGMTLRNPDESDCYSKKVGYIPAKIHQILDLAEQRSAVIPGCGAPYNGLLKRLKVTEWNKIILNSGTIIDSTPPPWRPDDTLAGQSIDTLAANAMTHIIGAPVQLLKNNLTPNEIVDELRGQTLAKNNHPTCISLGLQPEATDTNMVEGTPTLCWLESDLNKVKLAAKLTTINLIGHSRGGVVALVTANLLAKYMPSVKVNIIGLDPVPGPGYLPPYMCTLNQRNLNCYIGIYAIDETSGGFNAVVPGIQLTNNNHWDPLKSGYDSIDEKNYKLIFSRGRHATIPGSLVADGTGDHTKASKDIGCVGELIHHLCLNRLQHWNVTIGSDADANHIDKLKTVMTNQSEQFYQMRNTGYTGMRAFNNIFYYNARGITSTAGSNPRGWDYLQKYIPQNTSSEQGNNNKPAPEQGNHIQWSALGALATDTWFVSSQNLQKEASPLSKKFSFG